MGSFNYMIIISMLGSTLSWPQNGVITIPKVDFSPAHEVNNLEPSAIPELEHRSFSNSGNYLEATVEEVQSIIKSNPDLPRLTRGEILELLENITKEDMERLRTLNKNNRNGKAILLVMPYTPKNHGEPMEDLYTKKPVTQLIDTDNNEPDVKKVIRRKKPTDVKKERVTIKSTTTPISITTGYTTIDITTYRPRTRPVRTRPSTIKPVKRRRITTAPTTTTQKFLPENAIRGTRPTIYRSRRPTTTSNPDLSPAESYVNNVYVKYEPTDKNPDLTIKNYNPYQQQFDFHPVFKPLAEESPAEEQPNSAITAHPLVQNVMIPDDLKHLVDDLDLNSAMKTDSVKEQGFKLVTEAPTTTTTTTEFAVESMPKIEEVADSFTPDMKNILMTFGLLPNPDEVAQKPVEISGYYPEKAVEHRDSYVGFKPLPEDGETDKEMSALLASFGLGRSARKGKTFTKKPEKRNKYDFSMIPDSMMDVVESLGLNEASSGGENLTEIPRAARKIDRIDETKNNDTVSAEDISRINELYNEIFNNETQTQYFEDFKENETEVTTQNVESMETTTKDTSTSVVFNPTDPKIVPEEKDQLDKLMSLIKTIKNMNASQEDGDVDMNSLNSLTQALNTSQLTLGEQLSNEINPIFSETIETTTESITTTTNSTETKNEIEALEEAFADLPEEETEAPTTKTIPSGVYYLFDWNQFLEVDDGKGRHVNLRFQPTVGDPSRFYSIDNS